MFVMHASRSLKSAVQLSLLLCRCIKDTNIFIPKKIDEFVYNFGKKVFWYKKTWFF